MRVISGSAKGFPLKAPGRPTRPATDLVRGAIFSILENMTDKWDRVLDLFSGSGALGIEALSRGAGWVDFVERDAGCCAIIRGNLEKTRLAESARIHCTTVARAISSLDQEYDIVLVDPPYSDPEIDHVVEQLAASRIVGRDTVVVVTHSSRRPLQNTYGSLRMIKEHRHGDSTIALYRKESTA